MSLSFYKINVINNTDLHFHSIVPFSLSHQLPMPSIKLVWNLLSKFGILSAMCQVTCVSCRLKYLTSLAIPSPSTTNLFLCLYLMSLAEYFKWSQRHVHLAPISPLLTCLVGWPIRRCLFKFLLLSRSSQYCHIPYDWPSQLRQYSPLPTPLETNSGVFSPRTYFRTSRHVLGSPLIILHFSYLLLY